MLKQSILTSINSYIKALKNKGINIDKAVVFGSQITGKANKWSDIDLILISSQFDNLEDRYYINLLWRIAARIDSRIEPIPCGLRQWSEDDSSAIIEIARREGTILDAA